MERMVTVNLMLHPLVWRVLRRDYAYDGSAVDLGRSWLYAMVVACLERKQVIMAGELRRLPKDLVTGNIYIRCEDYMRYGGFIRTARQANISRVVYRMERARLCEKVSLLHVAAGVERNKAMRHVLSDSDITEEELSFEALKKHYQRNWREKEDNLILTIKELKEK